LNAPTSWDNPTHDSLRKIKERSMNDANSKTDPEMAEVNAALRCSIDQLQRGDHGVVITPAQMFARRATSSKLTLAQTFTEIALAKEDWSEFNAANADGLDKFYA
jgi:hypothetical protein